MWISLLPCSWIFCQQSSAEIVIEDRPFLRVDDRVFFEKRVLTELPKLQILKCYFEDSYLLSMAKILPERYSEALVTLKTWPKMRGLESDIFNLVMIYKMERHLRDTGMNRLDHSEKSRILAGRPRPLKECGMKKGLALTEFQQDVIAMEFSLRDRFSLSTGSPTQKVLPFTGVSESDRLASSEKFLKQFIANVYSQYGHYIFTYAP